MASAKQSPTAGPDYAVSRPLVDDRERLAAITVDRWAVCSLVAIVAWLYWPTAGFDFVNWDDPWYVTHNELIRSWHPANLVKIATQVVTRNYAPLTILSYLIDHTLWGEWPGGYHISNYLLHAANSVLVFILLRNLTGNRLLAWLTAILFAVHPMQVETVAWVSSRKGLLSATFILAALINWLKPERSPENTVRGLVFFFFALLSKAITVVVPAIVLLYDVLIVGISFQAAVRRQFVPACLAGWLLLITMSAQTSEVGGVRAHFALSKAHILAVDSVIVWEYVGMLVWPRDLCVLYDPPTSGIAARVTLASLGWCVVGALAWRVRRSRPLAVLALASFIVLLIPVLNLFPITTLMNDRYLYLPSIPFFALIVGGVVQLSRKLVGENSSTWIRSQWFKRGLTMATVVVMSVGYGRATQRYLPVWRHGLSLWTHAMQHVPQLPVVQIQYANTLHDLGRDKEAIAVLQKAMLRGDADHTDRKRIAEKLASWSAGAQ